MSRSNYNDLSRGELVILIQTLKAEKEAFQRTIVELSADLAERNQDVVQLRQIASDAKKENERLNDLIGEHMAENYKLSKEIE